MQTLEKVKGIEVLTEACNACKASIDKRKGRLVVKEAARAVRPAAPLCRIQSECREEHSEQGMGMLERLVMEDAVYVAALTAELHLNSWMPGVVGLHAPQASRRS